MGDDEGFSVLTAALYDATAKKMLIQYNNTGARSGSIAEYIGELGGGEFLFEPTLKRDIEALLHKNRYAKSISFTYRTGVLSPADEKAKRSLYQAIGKAADDIVREHDEKAGEFFHDLKKTVDATGAKGVGKIQVIMSKEDARGSMIEQFTDFVKSVLRINENTSRVLLTSAKAEISPSPDDAAELLNFMKAHESLKLKGLERGKKTMYPLKGKAGRGQKLLDAHREWMRRRVIFHG